MSKITRKKLVKGTKLQAQPVDDLYTAAGNEISNATINDDNVEHLEGTFRLNWWLSNINWANGTVSVNPEEANEQAYNFPFILPPTQDIFNTTIDENSKYYTMKDLTLSIDQGDEPIDWLVPHTDTSSPTGYSWSAGTKSEAGKFEIDIYFWNKTPSSVASNTTHWENNFASFNIPGTAFIANNMALNPFVIKDINKILAPDQAYCMSVVFRGETVNPLEGVVVAHIIRNLQISVRLSTPLRKFVEDSAIAANPTEVQNAPVLYKEKTGDAIGLSSINPGNTIQEDPLQTNIEDIDKRFHNKLQGGHNTLWSKPLAEQQTELMAYDVFTVQMFNNNNNYKLGGYDIDHVPYNNTTPGGGGGPGPGPGRTPDSAADRRVVPIFNPYEIHAIYLAWQTEVSQTYTSHTDPLNTTPTLAGQLSLDVVLHSGWRSDRYATQVICSMADMEALNIVDASTDPLLQNFESGPWTTTSLGNPTMFIQQLTLNYEAGGNTEGTGYFNTGIPVYVGRGIGSNSDQRSFIANSNPATAPALPTTLGLEKLLEFRIVMTDLTLDANNRTDFVSPPGFTFIVVCKKNLVYSAC